jgi:hypothetical protein
MQERLSPIGTDKQLINAKNRTKFSRDIFFEYR